MIEKLEILRISFLDVDIGRYGSVSCWIVSIQSSRWHQRRLRQFDFGLTCKNEILSVWLGREPSFFMNLLHCAISVVRHLPHLESQLFFSKGNSRHSNNIPVHNCLVEVYVWAAATIYLPRWSIWPVGSFEVYRPWKHQTQSLLELCHLLAWNSEIRMCVAPSIEISLDSNT